MKEKSSSTNIRIKAIGSFKRSNLSIGLENNLISFCLKNHVLIITNLVNMFLNKIVFRAEQVNEEFMKNHDKLLFGVQYCQML